MRLPARTLAATGAAGLLLTGCTADSAQDPVAGPPSTAGPAVGSSPTASPTSTATRPPPRRVRRAVVDATEAVRAYEQMIRDILTDPTHNPDDMTTVTTQPQLDLDLQELRGRGAAARPVAGAAGVVVVASADPVEINLRSDPPTVVLLACVDRSSNSATGSGQRWTADRELSLYRVVTTTDPTDLPDPEWVVAQVLPPTGHNRPQPC